LGGKPTSFGRDEPLLQAGKIHDCQRQAPSLIEGWCLSLRLGKQTINSVQWANRAQSHMGIRRKIGIMLLEYVLVKPSADIIIPKD
jgi:hypothetical protein